MTLVDLLMFEAENKEPELSARAMTKLAQHHQDKFWDIRFNHKQWNNPIHNKRADNHLQKARGFLDALGRLK